MLVEHFIPHSCSFLCLKYCIVHVLFNPITCHTPFLSIHAHRSSRLSEWPTFLQYCVCVCVRRCVCTTAVQTLVSSILQGFGTWLCCQCVFVCVGVGWIVGILEHAWIVLLYWIKVTMIFNFFCFVVFALMIDFSSCFYMFMHCLYAYSVCMYVIDFSLVWH